MKKLFTTLAIAGACVGTASAQKTVDIQVNEFLNPVENPNLADGDSILIGVAFTNLGPDAIVESDTIEMYLAGNGIATDGSNGYFVYTGYYGYNVPVGETDTITMWLKKGQEYSTSTGTVRNTLPNDTRDTFICYLSGVSPAGPFNDAGFNPDGTTFETRFPGSTNQIIARDFLFGEDIGIFNPGLTKNEINVYPNPTNSAINFNYTFDKVSNVATARIIDMTGRVVMTQEFGQQAAGSHFFNVNTNELPNGIYTLEFVTDNNRGVSKFTVSK